MNILYELGVGVVLGFTLTAPPGPMNVLIASRSARSLNRGIVTGMGAMSADAVLGGVVFVLSAAVDLTSFIRAIYVLGCLVMAYLGYRLLTPRPSSTLLADSPVRTYSSALLIGLSNPFQILWWLTAGLAFAYIGGLALFAGLFGAIAVWIVAFPYAVSAGARRSPNAERWITYGSGGILIAFAVYFAVLAVF
jgi:threonine/homoserine/homoserine lactone efflux protein